MPDLQICFFTNILKNNTLLNMQRRTEAKTSAERCTTYGELIILKNTHLLRIINLKKKPVKSDRLYTIQKGQKVILYYSALTFIAFNPFGLSSTS